MSKQRQLSENVQKLHFMKAAGRGRGVSSAEAARDKWVYEEVQWALPGMQSVKGPDVRAEEDPPLFVRGRRSFQNSNKSVEKLNVQIATAVEKHKKQTDDLHFAKTFSK
eukprot:Lankesteria_metandrocarpae@DN6438_c0_g1_i1.p1